MQKLTSLFLLAVISLILPISPIHADSHTLMTDNTLIEDPAPTPQTPRFLTTQSTSPHPDPAYLLTLRQWRDRHAAALTAPDGWLSLTALEWLKPGDTTVGSAPGSTLRLDHAPPHLATFRLTGTAVHLLPPLGGFPPGTTLNNLSATESPVTAASELRHGTLLLVVIQRGDRLYLRVRDAAAPTREHFRGLHWYAPDLQYRITARWVPSGMGGNLAVTNVLGQVSHESSPGIAEFILYGQTVRLFPIVEPGNTQSLFFIFRDTTSNSATYGAGRFLYTGLPSNGLGRPGTLILDFNRAENPPCAYTPYATCPLPPQQNRLTLPIPAGEKLYHE